MKMTTCSMSVSWPHAASAVMAWSSESEKSPWATPAPSTAAPPLRTSRRVGPNPIAGILSASRFNRRLRPRGQSRAPFCLRLILHGDGRGLLPSPVVDRQVGIDQAAQKVALTGAPVTARLAGEVGGGLHPFPVSDEPLLAEAAHGGVDRGVTGPPLQPRLEVPGIVACRLRVNSDRTLNVSQPASQQLRMGVQEVRGVVAPRQGGDEAIGGGLEGRVLCG